MRSLHKSVRFILVALLMVGMSLAFVPQGGGGPNRKRIPTRFTGYPEFGGNEVTPA